MNWITRRGRGPALLAMILCGTAAAQTVTEDAKLSPDDPEAGKRFGSAVSVSLNHMVIGAEHDSEAASRAGAAYVFSRSTGLQTRKLIASDAEADDFFGDALSISGTIAIIGAAADDDHGFNSGSAYIFNANSGSQQHKLTASDGDAIDLFGESVSISGNFAIVGAPGNDDAGPDSGSAYIFNITTGLQVHKLTASDAAESDRFGAAVAISGNTAIVGATGEEAAYVFNVTTGAQLHKLIPDDLPGRENFGVSVAIDGNTAVIGSQQAENLGTSDGAAYIFNTTTGSQLFKLRPDDLATADFFGQAVAISGTTAIIGAPTADHSGVGEAGAAYLFDATNGAQIAKIIASDAGEDDFLGDSVAIDGTTAIAGAVRAENPDAGGAYLLDTNNIPCNPADLAPMFGVLDLGDINAFTAAFAAQDTAADLTADGILDLDDVNAFVAAFTAGCP